jgi:hypothetical protein
MNNMTLFKVCKCDWKSKPYPDNTTFIGVGGQLSCPICTKEKRNMCIEVYGSVHVENEKGERYCNKCRKWKIFSKPYFCCSDCMNKFYRR